MENKEIIKDKKTEKSKVWKVIEIINYIAMLFFGVSFIVCISKLLGMKILPTRYVIIAIVIVLLILGINIWLRKKKVANIIFIILLVALGILFIQGFKVVNKVDEVIDKVTEGADIEVTVMEIRVLAEDSTSDVADLGKYTINFMKTRDRKYTDKVLDKIEEAAGNNFTAVEMEDDPVALVNALYDGEADAIIINSVYAAVFEEVEGYEDFATKTRVVQEIEIEEKIAIRKDSYSSENISTTAPPETTGGNNNGGSSGGNSNNNSGGNSGHDYGQYGEWGGGFVYNEPTSPSEMSKSAFVVYISGIDTYGNVNRKSRSDVNILMAVNTETKKIIMINTPRDYYVPLSVSNGVKDKLTHAGNYGVECSRDTLGMLYGVSADYYIRMNFTGFIDVIDAMNGVDVYSNYTFVGSGYSFTEGWNYALTGRAALAFARERKSFASGDNQRGKNQMALITAMINKATTADVILNYQKVLEAIAGSFQTNFTSEEIYALVHMQIDDMASWSIESYSVTGIGAKKTTYSIPSLKSYVMEPNYDTVEEAKKKMQAVLSGN